MTRPNFFIIGAPKCGTTSLAAWLADHPEAFICDPKEPRYFNSDWHAPFRPTDNEAYERLFAQAAGSVAIGEATTGYLVSDVAVGRILDYQPAARFVVCLRNPVDLFFSLHGQRLKEGQETIRDPAQAWKIQESRLEGRHVPSTCTDAKSLHYERYCRLGSQMDRLLSQISADRIHVTLMDDLRDDPDTVFRDLCQFLGLRTFSLEAYEARNQAQVPRSVFLSQIIRTAVRLKKRLRLPPLGMARHLREFNQVKGSGVADPSFRVELNAHFAEEIDRLEQVLSRDLSHWRV